MSVLSAARTLGQVSGWTLTQLTMQKVLYVAQMIHLGRTGLPLFPEQIEAWDKGPVVRELRRAVAHFRRELVPDVFQVPPLPEGSIQEAAVYDAYRLTKHMSVGQLITFTHRPGGAWEAHYREGHWGIVIPLHAIHAEWKAATRPSDAALAWANEMADELAETPTGYLDRQDERAFRARLCGSSFQ